MTATQKKNLRKLVKALRGKKYKQGQNALCYDDKKGVMRHCCLGVACEIAGMRREAFENSDERTELWSCRYSFAGQDQMLPHKVVKAFGFASSGGILPEKVEYHGKVCHSLAGLNDNGASFKKIATVIEAQFLGIKPKKGAK